MAKTKLTADCKMKDKKLKREWLKALRSGDFKQAEGQLEKLAQEETEFDPAREGGFCCLGVLCKISGKKYDPDNGGLPPSVVKATGLKMDPMVPYKGKQVNLSTLNDTNKLSFKQIALLIEKHL